MIRYIVQVHLGVIIQNANLWRDKRRFKKQKRHRWLMMKGAHICKKWNCWNCTRRGNFACKPCEFLIFNLTTLAWTIFVRRPFCMWKTPVHTIFPVRIRFGFADGIFIRRLLPPSFLRKKAQRELQMRRTSINKIISQKGLWSSFLLWKQKCTIASGLFRCGLRQWHFCVMPRHCCRGSLLSSQPRKVRTPPKIDVPRHKHDDPKLKPSVRRIIRIIPSSPCYFSCVCVRSIGRRDSFHFSPDVGTVRCFPPVF